jgi:hypothetical protein
MWLLILLLLLSAVAPAVAKKGDWGVVDPRTRMWFENARGSLGLCCDERDGMATDWEIRVDGYYVPVPWQPGGPWFRVPDDVIVKGNPTATAVIWFTVAGDRIRCFAPGPGN